MKPENFLRRQLNGPIARGELNTEPVLVKWRTPTSTPGNPNRESSQSGDEYADHEETLHPFVHHVQIATKGYQRYSEVQSGDVILDFLQVPDLTGRKDVQFIIAGITYVQKDIGRDLAEAWDLRCGGRAVVKTLLLRPQG